MGWLTGVGLWGDWGRASDRNVVLWCILCVLSWSVVSSGNGDASPPLSVPTPLHPDGPVILSTASPEAASHSNADSNGSPGLDVTQTEENSTQTNQESKNSKTHERFPVATFDWPRVQTPLIIAAFILVATLAKLVFHYQNKLSSLFPESCLLLLVGVIVGTIIYFCHGSDSSQLDSDTFFLYLLPPIILDAGYFIPSRSFFDNIGTIFLFAIVGTLVNALLLGFSLWGFSQSGGIGVIPYELTVLECLMFGVLLSAVDPVAVMAVFEEVHVCECLYIIVFGESLLNEGITVVLYHMFEDFAEIGQGNVQPADIGAGIGSFVVVTVCGALTGVVFGFMAALMTRLTDHVPVIQPLLVLVTGYLAYVFAEMFHLSGILACAFCGMTMRKYVEANMSRRSHTTTKYFLKMLSSISETVLFMYLGVSTVSETHQWDWAFCLLTLFFCLLYRTGVVIGLTAILNVSRLPKLQTIDQFIMTYGGLRGAIAFSLVIILDNKLFPRRNLFLTATVLVVFFTNFVMGCTIKPIVQAFRKKKKVPTATLR